MKVRRKTGLTYKVRTNTNLEKLKLQVIVYNFIVYVYMLHMGQKYVSVF